MRRTMTAAILAAGLVLAGCVTNKTALEREIDLWRTTSQHVLPEIVMELDEAFLRERISKKEYDDGIKVANLARVALLSWGNLLLKAQTTGSDPGAMAQAKYTEAMRWLMLARQMLEDAINEGRGTDVPDPGRVPDSRPSDPVTEHDRTAVG